jgi:sulfonate transport system permease protein
VWLRRARRTTGPVLVVVAWWALCRGGFVDTRFLPAPGEVLHAFHRDSSDGLLWRSLWVSLRRVVEGLGFGVSAGLVLGCLSGMSRLGEDLVDPIVQMFRTVPFIALSSLFIVWLGIGEEPKFTIVALATFFPIYLNTFNGIRNVDARLVEMAESFGASRLTIITKVVLRGALPQALLGLRLALGVSWLALVFAEQINADAGIGFMLSNAQSFLDTPTIMEVIAIYAMLGLITDAAVRLLEARLLRWRVGFTGSGR